MNTRKFHMLWQPNQSQLPSPVWKTWHVSTRIFVSPHLPANIPCCLTRVTWSAPLHRTSPSFPATLHLHRKSTSIVRSYRDFSYSAEHWIQILHFLYYISGNHVSSDSSPNLSPHVLLLYCPTNPHYIIPKVHEWCMSSQFVAVCVYILYFLFFKNIYISLYACMLYFITRTWTVEKLKITGWVCCWVVLIRETCIVYRYRFIDYCV